MAIDPEGRIVLSYDVDQGSVAKVAKSADTVTAAFARSAEQIAADNERLSAVVAQTVEKNNQKIAKSIEQAARVRSDVEGAADKEALDRNTAFNAQSQVGIEEVTRTVKINVAERQKLLKEQAEEEAADLKLREKQLQDALRDEIARRQDLADKQIQLLRDVEKVQQDMLRDEISKRKEFAAWQMQMQKELVENAKAAAIAEKQAIKEQIAELEVPFDEGDSGKSEAFTSQRKFSGRGFGALGRLTGRLGLPTGVSEGLFVAGEGITSTRGLSTVPIVGGAAKEGANLATAAFDSLAKSMGLSAAVVPPFVLTLSGLAAVLAPLAATVALIAAAVERFNTVIQPSKKTLEDASTALTAYFSVLSEGSTKTIRRQIDDLREQQTLNDAEYKIRKSARDNAFTSEQSGTGDLLARFQFGIADLTGAFKANDDRLKELEDQSAKTGGTIAGLTLAEQSREVAANDAREALIKQTDAIYADQQRKAQQTADLASISKLATTDQAAAELQRLDVTNKSITAERDHAQSLQAVYSQNSKTSDLYDEVTDKLKTYNQELTDNATQMQEVLDRQKELDAQEQLKRDLADKAAQKKLLDENGQVTTGDAAQSRLDMLKKQKEDVDQQIQDLDRRIAQADPLGTGSAKDLEDQRRQLQDNSKDLKLAIEDLGTRYVSILLPQDNYKKGLDVQQQGLESAAQALAKYNEIRDRVTKDELDLTAKFAAETKDIDAQRKLSADREAEDYQAKREQAESENAKKLAIADQDYYATRDKKIRDFNQQTTLADNKTQKKRLDDLAKYNADSVQAANDLQKKIGEIEAKTKDDIIDAAARLDARALDKALRSGKKQIDEAQKTFDEQQAKRKAALDKELADLTDTTEAEKQERQRAFNQQLADDADQHQKEHDRAVQAFRDQLALEDQARAIRLKRLAEDQALEDQARLAAYRAQLKALRDQLLEPMKALQSSTYAQILLNLKAQYDKFIFESALSLRKATDSFTPGQTKPRVGGAQTPQSSQRGSFDEGGSPPLGTAVQVGGQGPEMAVFTSPVKIYPSYASGRMSAGPSVNIGNIYLDGSPAGPGLEMQVRQVFHKVLGEVSHGP